MKPIPLKLHDCKCSDTSKPCGMKMYTVLVTEPLYCPFRRLRTCWLVDESITTVLRSCELDFQRPNDCPPDLMNIQITV